MEIVLSVDFLQNISECSCCRVLEGRLESLESDLVLQDVGPEIELSCVIQHPRI